jgi:hypothetical protein
VLTPTRIPIGKRAQIRMKRLIGLIARQRISLVLPSFNSLSEQDKMIISGECVQPWLEFPKELKAIACKKIMQMVAKSWRTHKSNLTCNFINKGLDATVKHTYILKEDWTNFVKLKDNEEAKAASEKYKKLRERNLHDHCLGTARYEGKIVKWGQEDREVAAQGLSNPWDQFPSGRPRNWLRAQSTLVKSEGSAEIRWLKDSAESVSKQIIEKQGALESSGLTLVRKKDVLIEVLGSPEQTSRVRGVSSYSGWKHWPDCTGM